MNLLEMSAEELRSRAAMSREQNKQIPHPIEMRMWEIVGEALDDWVKSGATQAEVVFSAHFRVYVDKIAEKLREKGYTVKVWTSNSRCDATTIVNTVMLLS